MINPSDLSSFCYYLVSKYGSPDRASEEQKASEFRHYYLRDLPPSIKALRIVASCCGLKLGSSDRMPENVRGYNYAVDGRNEIVIRDGDTVSGMQNTILHEIREIMERTFPRVCPDYVPLKTRARHYAANMFATSVLLPAERFISAVYDTGFDVIELSNVHSKSSSQVLLRIGEVLEGKLFLYGALYEPDADGDWRVSYWTDSRNEEDPDANLCGLDGFFPRKNRRVAEGSLVDMAIRKARAHFVERITVLDDGEEEGLAAIANPLVIQGVPVRVALMVLLERNTDLLSPQIRRLNPVVVNTFCRHL